MSRSLTVPGAVELATVDRGGFVESRHSGVAVVLSPDGTIRASFGDGEAALLPRSSLKPLQAVGMLTAGVELEGERLGLATASHTGTDRHVGVVRAILEQAGLTEDALGCPAARASDPETRDRQIRDLDPAAPVRMNCSGKHAGMLLTCVTNDWDTAGYLDLDHPLQRHLRDTIERLTGEKVQASVVDGCGAPIHAVTLSGLARGIHRMGTASERSPFALHRHAAAVVRAVRENPWTIAGPDQPDTLIAERLGVFAKLGAEGVQVAVAPDGTTVALKMLDGGQRAAPIVALTLLQTAGALSAADVTLVANDLHLDIRGGSEIVGRIRPTVGVS
ncbi:L-asparaginase II [Microbacterium sp. C448]|uniref:asparaginase n=1 Tax=Microbacterium sp. C448 TaxID=1177594 RepID=UPI0003DE6CC5|nr:asparaginase [Microbacterium sp. C448]CDJ99437.1 L-asparaginase II [Microbacterium sp. C448]